jgi:hypothetical protein
MLGRVSGNFYKPPQKRNSHDKILYQRRALFGATHDAGRSAGMDALDRDRFTFDRNLGRPGPIDRGVRMKCQSPTERMNRAHLARVTDARRALDDRRTAEAMAAGEAIRTPRPHHILNRIR